MPKGSDVPASTCKICTIMAQTRTAPPALARSHPTPSKRLHLIGAGRAKRNSAADFGNRDRLTGTDNDVVVVRRR
jgi:hypothetical protein